MYHVSERLSKGRSTTSRRPLDLLPKGTGDTAHVRSPAIGADEYVTGCLATRPHLVLAERETSTGNVKLQPGRNHIITLLLFLTCIFSFTIDTCGISLYLETARHIRLFHAKTTFWAMCQRF